MNIATALAPSQKAEYYLTLPSIRAQCSKVFELARNGRLHWFEYHPDKEGDVLAFCENLLQRDWRDNYSQIPAHGRHRHFDIDNSPPRLSPLISRIRSSQFIGNEDRYATTKSLVDLFVVSVLLDAGAGTKWKYKEKETGLVCGRSEGLAIASLDMFKEGLFSTDDKQPYRADANALERLTPGKISQSMQVSENNPMEGLNGRAEVLIRLASAMKAHPEHFGSEGGGRPGGIVDFLANSSKTENGVTKIHINTLWHIFTHSLSTMWPSRHSLAGIALGDAWPCPALGDGEDAIVPFHKLTQWLSWSLVALLQRSVEDGGCGWVVEGTEEMTGLPEYRNGGLLVDLGLLSLKESALKSANPPIERSKNGLPKFEPGHPAIVEWRALTVIMLDHIHAGLNKSLKLKLTLPQVLEAVTWKGGREIAKSKREDGGPPIEIISDGTVF